MRLPSRIAPDRRAPLPRFLKYAIIYAFRNHSTPRQESQKRFCFQNFVKDVVSSQGNLRLPQTLSIDTRGAMTSLRRSVHAVDVSAADFLSQLRQVQSSREAKRNPEQNDAAYRMLRAATEYLSASGGRWVWVGWPPADADSCCHLPNASAPPALPPSVPPNEAPELFISMAKGPEVAMAEAVLLGHRQAAGEWVACSSHSSCSIALPALQSCFFCSSSMLTLLLSDLLSDQ